MTRTPRRTSLFLSFSLLTIATSVHAECSWVLWTYTLDRYTGGDDLQVLLSPRDRGPARAEGEVSSERPSMNST